MAKISAPLVSFATSPQNAPSLLISTLLVNALAVEIQLNLAYLILTYLLIAIYFALLWVYAIVAVNSSQADLRNFTRHVFYASIFGRIALVILWSDFILGYFYNGEVLFSLFPNLRQIKNWVVLAQFILPIFSIIFARWRTGQTIIVRVELRALASYAWRVSIVLMFSLGSTIPFLHSQIISELGILAQIFQSPVLMLVLSLPFICVFFEKLPIDQMPKNQVNVSLA